MFHLHRYIILLDILIADTDNEKRVSKKSNFKNDFYFCLSSGERSFPQKFCLALGKASKVWSNASRF